MNCELSVLIAFDLITANRVILIHVELNDRGAPAARADYGIYTLGKLLMNV
jgi:hypothetical protein